MKKVLTILFLFKVLNRTSKLTMKYSMKNATMYSFDLDSLFCNFQVQENMKTNCFYANNFEK